MLPNSSRAACVTADTGFHSAIVLSGPGRPSDGTKVLAMNVIGKITMNEALLTTSGAGAISPTYAITQLMAYANSSNSRKPPSASSTEVRTRQPTTSPVSDMTVMTMTL